MKTSIFFAAQLFFFLTFNFACAQDLQKLIKRVDPSVVKIYTIDGKNEYASQGSGIFITNNGVCISNYHVLIGAKKAIVITASGKKFEISKIIDYSKENDLIKFKVDLKGEISSPVIINEILPSKGENVFAVGYPNGFVMEGESTITPGIISGFREENGLKLIQTNTPFTHGSSGGGLFNSTGKFIGVTSGTYATDIKDRHANMNKVIPVYLVKKLTRNLNLTLSGFYESLVNDEKYIQGMIAYESLEFDKAIQLFYLHLEEFPEDATTWFRLGNSYNQLGRVNMNKEYLNSALGCFDNAISLDSNYYHAWGQSALILSIQGQIDMAKMFAYEAYRIEPNVSFTNYVIGKVSNEAKEYSLAIEFLSYAIQKANEYDKNNLVHQWYLEKAIANAWLKNDYLAEQDYQACLKYNPVNLDALFWYGNFLVTRKRVSESCPYFKKIKTLSPNYKMAGYTIDQMLQFNKCY